jgi:hypothetical protein
MSVLPRGVCWLAACCLTACTWPAADARFVEQLPERDTFPEVAAVLVRDCGALDCHGSVGRNLRLYGSQGLRLSSHDRPQSPACNTADEVAEDYTSLVGLEPERLGAVLADGGAHPERLTLLRKGLGLEHHKGGSPWRQGDDADQCLRSWLAGVRDRDACLRALPDDDKCLE